MLPLQINVPTLNAPLNMVIEPGDVMLITGPNGTGKSALIHLLSRGLGPIAAELFPGHRQIHFQSDDVENIGQTVDALTQTRYANPVNANRYRDAWSEVHFKSVLRRILDQENQTNRTAVTLSRGHALDYSRNSELTAEATRAIVQTIADVERNPSVIDTLNTIFETARLDVRLELVDGNLKAKRDGHVYGLDRLSDGERAAFLLVGAILVRPSRTIVLIDEPEKHLNPAISGSLLAASVRARSDIGYIFSSHDLSLVDWLSPKTLLTIKGSTVLSVTSDGAESRAYDAYLISAEDGVPEDVKRSILGARKSIIFAEGEVGSDDPLLYGLLYKHRSVVAKGSWETVISAVRVLRSNPAYHWMSVSGFIDNDGRNDAEMIALADEHVFSLKVPTIENLFFLPDVIRLMSEAAYDFQGGLTAEDRVNAAISIMPALLQLHHEDIVNRRVAWIVNRMLSERKVSVRSVAAGPDFIEGIDLLLVKEAQRQSLGCSLVSADFSTLERVPVKNTGIPAKLSASLGFESFTRYKAAVCRQIDKGDQRGQEISSAMRRRIPIQ